MLGDEEAGNSKEVSKVNLGGRTFTDTSLGKGKSVSCIKFHPKKPHLLALSLIDKLNFVERTDKIGKSFDSNVVITNISEETSLPPNYILTTPVEITVFEFHPENPNIIVGGAMNGQLIAWDVASADHRIYDGKKVAGKLKMPDEEEDKTQ